MMTEDELFDALSDIEERARRISDKYAPSYEAEIANLVARLAQIVRQEIVE